MPVKKYVLFSPIGNHDPFGYEIDKDTHKKKNITEGPMLHIIRHYKPEVVFLFMTNEIYAKHLKDCRYEKCIKKIAPDCKVEILETGIDIIDVHKFDAFVKPYKGIFEKIHEQYPEHKILYNITSATPQMISALILESMTSSINPIAIQVSSPQKKSNFHDYYEENDEIDEEYEEQNNRTIKPDFLAFKKMRAQAQIKSLIKKYEYGAANNLLKYCKNLFENEEEIKKLLTETAERLSLNQEFEQKSDKEKFLEYFYTVKIKYLKGEYADFALRLVPIITDLLKYFIEKNYLTSLDSLVEYRTKNKMIVEKKIINGKEKYFYENGEEIKKSKDIKKITPYFTRNKISEYDKNHGTGLINYLDENFKNTQDGKFNDTFVNTQTLKHVAKYFVEKNETPDTNNYKTFERLEDLSSESINSMRNKFAHEMVGVTKEKFKILCECTPETILENLEECLSNLEIYTSENTKFIYDEINRKIISLL